MNMFPKSIRKKPVVKFCEACGKAIKSSSKYFKCGRCIHQEIEIRKKYSFRR